MEQEGQVRGMGSDGEEGDTRGIGAELPTGEGDEGNEGDIVDWNEGDIVDGNEGDIVDGEGMGGREDGEDELGTKREGQDICRPRTGCLDTDVRGCAFGGGERGRWIGSMVCVFGCWKVWRLDQDVCYRGVWRKRCVWEVRRE